METIKENITLKLKKVVQESEGKFDKEELQSFELAIKEFDELVKKGLVKKRGYTLITIEEKHLKNAQYTSNY